MTPQESRLDFPTLSLTPNQIADAKYRMAKRYGLDMSLAELPASEFVNHLPPDFLGASPQMTTLSEICKWHEIGICTKTETENLVGLILHIADRLKGKETALRMFEDAAQEADERRL